MATYLTPEQAKNLLTDLQPGAKIEIEITPTGEIVVSSDGNDNVKTKQEVVSHQLADKLTPLVDLQNRAKFD